MAASVDTSIISEVTGLNEVGTFIDKFAVTATATKAVNNRQIQASADTDEAINLCGIGTVELLCIKCVSNDVDVDLNYSSSFSADLTIPEGESAVIPKPVGVIRIKNDDAGEAVTIDVLIIGSA
jgi:autotransporter adhesin